MFYVETSGSHYEMGVQFGRATALQIGSMLDYLTKGFRHWDEAKFQRAREQHLRCTERHCPELIEEVQGIADGSGVPFRWIYLMNFYAVLREPKEGCTNIIFPRTPDGPLLAKTNDLPVHEGHHSGVRVFRPAGGMAFLGSSFPGTVWCGGGVNEAGLAIGGSSCAADVPAPAEALSPHVVNRHALSRAATVREAVALLQTLTVPRWGANIPLVDRAGAAAIVEKAGSVQGVRWSKGEPIFCANFSCTTEMSAYRINNPPVLAESTDRFAAMERLTRGREPTVALLRQTLAHTDPPGAVSRYGDSDPLKYETEFAAIFYSSGSKAGFCFSHPDRDPWRMFAL
ncbi:MAG: hypothetical protein HY360_19785 [Verrucomicrobia bacterium]|nr:hypothetical protein [Verrucomicrobiota bacterium]